MNVRRVPAFASVVLWSSLAGPGGCAADNTIPEQTPATAPAQCTDDGSYVAFDVAHHAPQDARLQAHVDIMGLLDAAVADPTRAATAAAAARDLYVQTADLQAKVQGRTDDHLPDRPNVGAAIDARIVGALDAVAAASDGPSIAIAAEIIDKSFAEFFFLSIVHELLFGEAETWDEAWGYYGAPADNDLGALRGFSAIAARRDENNQTALQALVFQRLQQGSCALARRLAEGQVSVVDVRADDELNAIVDEIDLAMQHVLAASVGHEMFEIADARTANDPGTARIKLIEADTFFGPIERLMRARGGDSLARATDVRTALDAARNDATDAWLAEFPDVDVTAALEAEYAIDVRE